MQAMLKKLVILSLFVVLFGAIGFLYYDHVRLVQQVQYLEADKKAPITVRAPEQVDQPITAPGTETWAHTQSKIKDTVVQVFSQIAEADLLEPYKTPSQGQSFGSGFFISEDGEIITNAHVVSFARSVWIQIPSLGKRIIDVTIVGVCPERDLALLRVTPESLAMLKQEIGKIPHLPLGDSDHVFRADEILALGYPLGQNALKSTTGVVSGRENMAGRHFIQMSAPINPGSSGGPSLNRNGQVIGINSAIIQGAQNVGYIIPINEFKIISDDLHKEKLLRKPFLGIRYLGSSEALVDYLGNPKPGGCYVAEVYKKSLLDKAGLKIGDMIYEIDGNPVDLYGEMTVPWSEDKITIADYVSRLKLGQKIAITFYRQGKKKNISLTFDYPELLPIRMIYPEYEELPYEVFAGMVVMPLTLNHVALLHQHVPALSQYTETKDQLEPALLLTHIFPDSQAHRSRALTVGSIITEVNGKKVKTIDDFRQAVIAGKSEKFVTVKTNNNVFVAFPLEKVLSEEKKLSRDFRYAMSSLIKNLQEVQAA